MKKHSKRARGTGSLAKARNGKYLARFTGADGREVKRSTGTSDRRDAETILSEWLRQEARVKAGLEAPGERRRADQSARTLEAQLEDYLAAFERSEARTPLTMRVRRSVFNQSLRISRLILRRDPLLRDLTPDLLERIMHHRLTVDRVSARTANTQHQYLCAFAVWATQDGRCDLGNLSRRVRRRSEDLDRRRVRRALSEAEAERLCAGPRGVLYRLVLETGLRRGELARLRWSAIDLEARTVTVASTKVRRVDVLPIATDALVGLLEALRPLLAPGADPCVFESVPTARTVERDFMRAGIETVDADGRVADLHALRKTLGTRLARAGTAPQVAQRIMRHTDYRTTQRHYEHLVLDDQRAALERALASSRVGRADGTSGAALLVGPASGEPGTSRGTSRGTVEGAKGILSVRPEARGLDIDSPSSASQPLSLRDFVRALAERCESVLNSRALGTIGAVG